MGQQNIAICLTLGRIWQALSRRHCRLTTLAFCLYASIATTGFAQLVDSLDAYPPRWHLGHSDCEARIVNHSNAPSIGVGGSGCESISMQAGHGTQAMLEYRIEPIRVIEELTARVFVKSAKTGQSVGLRIRFPLVIDPATGQSVSVIILGANYREAGQWQMLGVGAIVKPLRLKSYALRQQYGAEANFNEAFVDAVVINAYTGPGDTSLLIDNLAVDAMVPVASMRPFADPKIPLGQGRLASERFDTGEVTTLSSSHSRSQQKASPFHAGRIWRILQHNGEPLQWVKTLGFDAVLLSRPVDQPILTEAMQAGVKVFAPPPTTPDSNLTALLEPLAGYYLGTSLAAQHVGDTSRLADQIAKWPDAWQRPVIAAPAESFRQYAVIADALVHDLSPPIRGLTGPEEIAALAERQSRSGVATLDVVGVQTDAPEGLKRQLDAISSSIGAPRGEDLYWHSLLLQVARSLELSPRAILFRSPKSLTTGTPEAQHRSLALSYVNRYLASVGPLVAVGAAMSPLTSTGPAYHCGRINFPGGQLMIMTTKSQHRGTMLAGDGDALQISLPPNDSTKLAWRLTHFTAERLSVQSSSSGVQIEIISPDVVETIVLSDDPRLGGRLANSLKSLASQAAIDRWQLTREALQQIRNDWQAATATRMVAPSPSALDMIRAAQTTLTDSESTFRAGDAGSTLRMARRADAWTLKARWQLHAALAETANLTSTTSCPPLLASGAFPAQVLWWPLMADEGWSENLLIGGSLDSPALLGQAGWAVGKRPSSLFDVQSDVTITTGPQIEGDGCLLANVVAAQGERLPGGYAGTTLQIRSPSIRFAEKTPVRIDAKIRTLGFGGPDQGVLVYDNIGGAELGVLARATPQWQNIRLYRQTLVDGDVNVLFELIGVGEVAIDDVQIRAWTAKASEPLPFRQISQLPESQSPAPATPLKR